MLKDITFGQYLVGDSVVHRLDARTKLLLVIMYIVMLFACRTAVGLAIAVLVLPVFYIAARVPFKMAIKSLKPILPLIIFTTVLNLVFTTGDKVLFSFWVITVTEEGLFFSVFIMLRIVSLLAGTSLLTYTTSPIELTDGIERITSPLAKLKFPSHELAMMMTIALRFIPTLIDETDKIMNAQKSRGAQLDTGKLGARIKAMIPILVPLLVSSFRRADELATAMECRCYHGGEGRTRLKTSRFHLRDLVAFVLMSLLIAAVFITNGLFTAVV